MKRSEETSVEEILLNALDIIGACCSMPAERFRSIRAQCHEHRRVRMTQCGRRATDRATLAIDVVNRPLLIHALDVALSNSKKNGARV